MNEEKIIIDIAINDGDLKQRMSDLTAQIKLQKASLDIFKDTLGENSKEYIQLNAEMKLNQQEMNTLNKVLQNTIALEKDETVTLESLKRANNLLRAEREKQNIATEEGQKKIKEINEQIDKNNELIVQNSDRLKKQTLNVGNYTDSVLDALKKHDELNESYKENQNSLKNLTIVYNTLISTQGAESEEAEKVKVELINLTQTINEQGKALKKLGDQNEDFQKTQEDLNKEMENNKKSVNELTSVVQGGFGSMIGYFSELNNKKDGVTDLFKSVVSGFKSALKSALAFLASPFGLILTGVAAAFGLVTAAMSKNKELSNKVSDTWTGVKSSLSGVWDAMTNMAASAVEGIRGNTEKMKKYASDSANAMKNVITGVTAANAVALEQMKRQNEQLNNLSEQTIKIRQNELSKLEAMTSNQALSAKDQMNLQMAITAKKNEIVKDNIDMAQREADELNKLYKQQKEANIDVTDTLKKSQEAHAKVAALETELTTNSIAAANELRNISKDQLNETLDYLIDNYDKHKTNNEKIINNDKETFENRFALLEETKKLSLENTQLQVQQIEKFGKVKIDLDKMLKETNGLELGNQIKSLNLSEDIGLRLFEIIKERQAAVGDFYDLENGLIQAKTDADLKSLNTSLEFWKEENKTKIDGNKRLNEQIISEEEKRLNLLKTKELENLQAQYQAGSMSLDDYNLNVLKKENEIGAQLLSVRKSYDEQSKTDQIARDVTNYENRYAIAEGNIFKELELQKQKLQLEKEAELKTAEEIHSNKQLIVDKYAKLETDLWYQKEFAKIEISRQFADGIAGLFEKNTIVGKAAAVAQTTINTYAATIGAFKDTPGPLFLRIAAAGIAAATGLKAIKKILSVQTNIKGGAASSNVSNDTSGGGGASNVSSLTTQNAQMIAPSIGQGIVSRNTITNVSQSNVNQPVLVVDSVTNAQLKNTKMNEISSI